MDNRWVKVIMVVVFILLVCPAAYLWFTSAGMGYSPRDAGTIAGAIALVGLLLIPLAWKGKL